MSNGFADLLTPQGEALSGQPWQVYPRPQLERDSFFNLNGSWQLTYGDTTEDILVPFAPESILSGVHKHMGEKPCITYKKQFSLPQDFNKGRIILHFGAVDQITHVTLNGVILGEHYGGYLPFEFDVTDCIRPENALEVTVTDELYNHILPYGKQREERGTIWYTPHCGIWQTVWLESVPKTYVKSLKIDIPDLNHAVISAKGISEGVLTVTVPEGEITVRMENGVANVLLENPVYWRPERPYLYRFTLVSGEDRIKSYFAMRTLKVMEIDGIKRLCLNDHPYFFHGLLDQGYWSDGICTPASPECYTEDILAMKRLGFNTLRKHIKVEPEQFYYECDRLGVIVFQDMVNNGEYHFIRDTAIPSAGIRHLPDRLLNRDKATRSAFINAMTDTVNHLYNHPCICYWTIFNEGWGQFNGSEMYNTLTSIDSSRFVDTTSGWFFGPKTQVKSHHIYFRPVKIKKHPKLPVVLSEFGGYSFRPEGHAFNPDHNFGYGQYHTAEEFEDALVSLYRREIIPAVKEGLCASIYTQVSDVEDETNGLLSFDRKVIKATPEKMLPIAEKLADKIKETL